MPIAPNAYRLGNKVLKVLKAVADKQTLLTNVSGVGLRKAPIPTLYS